MRRRVAKTAGTNLSLDPRTGYYIWRRRDETTGARIKRSTRTPSFTHALTIAAKFEDEYQDRRAGFDKRDGWKLELVPLVEEWVKEAEVLETTRALRRAQLKRALAELGLVRCVDLADVSKLDKRLRARPEPRVHLRRSWQDPLRGFSKWLASNQRYLDRDPLATWAPIRREPRTSPKRRAFLPEEVARALEAAADLDQVHGRKHPMRPVFLALLITAPRATALCERDAGDLDEKNSRIGFGAGVGKKGRGEGALDPTTLAELVAYRGARREGPLFLSPRGERLDHHVVRDTWREAFSLGVVRGLWRREPDRELERPVAHYLMTGHASVSRGGNPANVNAATVLQRERDAARVREAGEELRLEWEHRMDGVDVHAFRMTHRTWAEAAGVHPVLIDKQLGHSTGAGNAALEAATRIVSSDTGSRFYRDLRAAVLDARKSAIAVRGLLENAQLRPTAGRGVASA